MSSVLREINRLGQSVWYDGMRRALLTSGEFKRLLDSGVSGATSNPTIFEHAVVGSADYDSAIRELSDTGLEAPAIYERLVLEDIGTAADQLRPIHDRTHGMDGYVSLEVRPTLAHDTRGSIQEAKRLFRSLNRPNVMIKIPATPEGIPAIEALTAEGVNINITLMFSLSSYEAVMDAYLSGLNKRLRAGQPIDHVHSVASLFVSRIDTAVDRLLEVEIAKGRTDLEPLLGRAALANARQSYERFRRRFSGESFDVLRRSGGNIQRLLWASTATKNPKYKDLRYVEALIGPDTIDTVPPETLQALEDHGVAAATAGEGLEESKRTLAAVANAGIDLDTILSDLQAKGIAAFTESFDRLLVNLEAKRTRLLARDRANVSRLGSGQAEVDRGLQEIDRDHIVARMWAKDHTVWKPDPTEITNRLGWLTVCDLMLEHVDELMAYAAAIRKQGYHDLVLLGMGGSSLAPEVLRSTFGPQPGYPNLHVLDSTIPTWVRAVTRSVDPAKTLFIVSSKSGGTIEVVSLYRHFRARVEEVLGRKAGDNFIAITDPGTGLEEMAHAERFSRVFLNPADIGGRYSALSYFGMVPAALAGLHAPTLLLRGAAMAAGCAPAVPVNENPGAQLGVILGSQAQAGRSKVTFICSPRLASFGLWAEQLIAESTGKEGKGILPIALEPYPQPDAYGDDRLFVYMELEGDDNRAVEAHVSGLEDAGQPVVRLTMRDPYDLGAEFFRWEFGVALAGSRIGIQPFDQPNVQESKDNTAAALQQMKSGGLPPALDGTGSLEGVLAQARPGDSLGLMAFLDATPALDDAIEGLRAAILERRHLPTTAGYGPRFLHSTGQLHKGGPNNGLFVQLVADWGEDLPIPGEPYTFGGLAAAQVAGDYTSLVRHGRRIVRLHLGHEPLAEIRRLTAGVKAGPVRESLALMH